MSTNDKKYVVVKVKQEYSRFGIPEMVRIYYNPYNWTVKRILDFWIAPEFRHKVYGYKIK